MFSFAKRQANILIGRARQAIGPATHLHGYQDYETYRAVQDAGYRQKMKAVFAREANIRHIAEYAERTIGQVRSVLCHGTRNGAEQRFFKAALPTATVLGTEIGEGASQFPDTIEWDFHNVKPEWIGAWDLIYSNAWDHAHNPELAFGNWLSCLSPTGLMMIEHTLYHAPHHTSELDPFGASLPALRRMLKTVGGTVITTIADLPVRKSDQRVLVVKRT